MNKKTFFIYILSFLTLVISILLYRSICREQEQSIVCEGLRKIISSYKDASIAIDNRIIEFDVKKQHLDINIPIKDSYGNIKPLYTILKDSTHFFVFSKNECSNCINEQLSLLKNNTNNNLIIISNHSSIRDLDIILNSYDINIPHYTYCNTLISSLDSINSAYYISCNKNGIINDCFIPITNIRSLTKKYINSLL